MTATPSSLVGDELVRLAQGCLLAGFKGPVAPDWIRRRVEGGLGGVTLFASNCVDREQLGRLTATLRAARPLVIAVDEEGGDVTRLHARRGSPYPGHGALGVLDDPVITRRVAAAIGAELAEVGITCNLAPCADVNTEGDNPVIGTRSFSSDPAVAARHTAAFVEGLQQVGVAACAKHFPGHGSTIEDSHLSLPTVAASRELLQAVDLVPFAAAVAAKTAAIMTAHLLVPAYDYRPATLSRAILTDLLRHDLGFEGTIITDALEMAGIAATVGMAEGAVQALVAGADALCLGADEDPDAYDAIAAAIAEAVRSGRLSEQRLRQAVDHTARLARPAGAVTGATGATGDAEGDGARVGREAAARALRVRGDVRLDRPALVVELRGGVTIAEGPLPWTLGPLLSQRLPGTQTVALAPGDALPEHAEQPLVVVFRTVRTDSWEERVLDALGRRRPGPATVLVNLGLPLAPGRWPQASLVEAFSSSAASLEAVAAALAPAPT
jgi:beta-N-acetylhexosaminidase